MAKFLTGNDLNSELGNLFERATEKIILISPYIKLHDRYASVLKTKKDNPKIEIIIVFGKNEKDISRSMKQNDFDFFKEFPNIEIRYEKRLHAKYYSNESYAIITSMNLYDFSQDNNIEAGVMTKVSLLGNIANNLISNVMEDNVDNTAFDYFSRVIDQSDLLFKKTPEYESGMFGLKKTYKSSKIEVDNLTEFFANKLKHEGNFRKDNFEKKQVEFIQTNNGIKTESHLESKVANNKISSATKFLSTTALSKEVGLSSKDLFSRFEKLKWIERKNDEWVLTNTGLNKGAQTKKGQYGAYISWPESIINEI